MDTLAHRVHRCLAALVMLRDAVACANERQLVSEPFLRVFTEWRQETAAEAGDFLERGDEFRLLEWCQHTENRLHSWARLFSGEVRELSRPPQGLAPGQGQGRVKRVAIGAAKFAATQAAFTMVGKVLGAVFR